MSGKSALYIKNLEKVIDHQVSLWQEKQIHKKHSYVCRPDFKDLERGLSILKIEKEEFGMPWTTAEEISALLIEVFDLSSTPLTIKRAFAKAGGSNKINKPIIPKKSNNLIFYKISQPGEVYMNSILGKGSLQVMYFKPNSHKEVYESLSSLVKNLKGKEFKISDPYYGVNTLNILEEFARSNKKVKFLSHHTNEPLLKFKREFNYLQKHYSKKIEIHIFPKDELHDRYILADDAFVIIGHGIKDLGNKESLVLVIDDSIGRGVRKELEKAFWRRWQDNTCTIL